MSVTNFGYKWNRDIQEVLKRYSLNGITRIRLKQVLTYHLKLKPKTADDTLIEYERSSFLLNRGSKLYWNQELEDSLNLEIKDYGLEWEKAKEEAKAKPEPPKPKKNPKTKPIKKPKKKPKTKPEKNPKTKPIKKPKKKPKTKPEKNPIDEALMGKKNNCLSCGKPIPEDKKFCNEECVRNYYEKGVKHES